MKDIHITFAEMSDLYDNIIPIESEKERIQKHIEMCPSCKDEYEKLLKTINLLSRFKSVNQEIKVKNYSNKIIREAIKRRRKKILVKFVPAVAAAILIIFGINLINSGSFKVYDNSPVTNESGLNETEKVLNIISNNNANILKVSEMFIEGEVPLKDYKMLRKSLGARNVVFSQANDYKAIDEQNQWRKNIEEVGIGTIDKWDTVYEKDIKKEEYIKFRVYR